MDLEGFCGGQTLLQLRRGVSEACGPDWRVGEENHTIGIVFNDFASTGELWRQMLADLAGQVGKPFGMLQQAGELATLP